ncbi:MAG: SUMF1/EgtB/PvdO family nonheme iron enzyme [Anaerolineae bacterium]|nr:SUMF1/EgtB/PvdO family nonheme iron enzyme [Anaerolineae bacterium]
MKTTQLKCPTCGSTDLEKLQRNERRCSYCGSVLRLDSGGKLLELRGWVCPKCDINNRVGQRFCGKCGSTSELEEIGASPASLKELAKKREEERRELAAKKQASLKPLPVFAILLILAAICVFTSCTSEPGELPELTVEQRLHESWAVASDDDKRAEEWEEVIGLIGQILAVNPGNADMIEKLYAAHVNYGLQFLVEGDPDGAVVQFNSALKIKPDGVEARAGLEQAATWVPTPTPVVVPTSTPPRTLTVEQLERSLHESWAVASNDDKRAEEWEEVIGLIEQILALSPGNADMIEKLYAAHVNHGRQFVEQGNLEEAKAEFTRALDVKADGGEAIAELNALAGETPGPPLVVLAPTATFQPPTATQIPPPPPSAAEAAMIAIPAGEFTMGSDHEIERPPHSVFVGAFEIDKFEVTNEQFKRFIRETGYVTDAEKAGDTSWRYYAKDKPQHPVVKVTWNDANALCEWAGKRLPTEAEWEKAARGTDSLTYPWGNDWDVNKANTKDAGYRGTIIVGSFPAGGSPYGVMDMAGNVAEWTSNWFQPYPGYPGGDSEAQYFGEKYRVIRGGGWFSDQNLVRTTERSASSMTLANDDVGFRCAR